MKKQANTAAFPRVPSLCYQPCHSWGSQSIPRICELLLSHAAGTVGSLGTAHYLPAHLAAPHSQLLSGRASCIPGVWSGMSAFADATSLRMARAFEETTQSLIKNSDLVSPAQPFPLPFHQDLSLSFWNVSCWGEKRNMCGKGWKTWAVREPQIKLL